MATPIGTLGNIPTLTIGGRVYTDLTTLIILHAYGSTRSCTMRRRMATSGYVVTGGTTLTLTGVHVVSNGTAPTGYFAQTDNDIGYDVTGAGTNPVIYGDGTANFQFHAIATAGSSIYYNPEIQIAATKYCSIIETSGGWSIHAYGYEA